MGMQFGYFALNDCGTGARWVFAPGDGGDATPITLDP